MKHTIEVRIGSTGLSVPHDTDVNIGDEVEWRIDTPGLPTQPVITAFVFEATSPFGDRLQNRVFLIASKRTGGKATILAGQATITGDHKYAVVVRDALNGQFVAEEDPWIHVRP